MQRSQCYIPWQKPIFVWILYSVISASESNLQSAKCCLWSSPDRVAVISDRFVIWARVHFELRLHTILIAGIYWPAVCERTVIVVVSGIPRFAFTPYCSVFHLKCLSNFNFSCSSNISCQTACTRCIQTWIDKKLFSNLSYLSSSADSTRFAMMQLLNLYLSFYKFS